MERQKLKGKRKNESKSGISPVAYLKKQSQFVEDGNGRNASYNKDL